MKFIFCQQTKRQRFLQIDTIILAVCGQAYPNPQNNKFAISLQYLKKKVSDGVSFLHEDKHVSWYYNTIVDTNWYYNLDGNGQAVPKRS